MKTVEINDKEVAVKFGLSGDDMIAMEAIAGDGAPEELTFLLQSISVCLQFPDKYVKFIEETVATEITRMKEEVVH